MRKLLAVSFVLSVALSLAPGGGVIQGVAAPSQVMSLVNVNVITMEHERVLAGQTVIVRDGRVTALGSARSVSPPKGALLIDGRGRYLIPGLADLHIHLRSTDELLSYLAYGVTTVLHLSGATSGAPDLLQYRAQLRQAELLGPTLYTSGPTVDGDPPIFPHVSIAVKTPEEARRIVEQQQRAGYDVIKVYNRLTPDAYDALLAAAKQQGIAVVGHLPRQVGLERALQAGQAMIAHGEEYFFTYFGGASDARLPGGVIVPPDESKIPLVAEWTRKAGVAVTPNLSFIASTKRMLEDLKGVLTDPETRYLPSHVWQMWQSNNLTRRRDLEQFSARERVKYPFVQRLTKGLSAAGVLLLLGTDASAPGLFPGQSAQLELRELVAAGLTPYQALAAGTRNAGKFVSQHVPGAEKFGTITVGGRADLILLEQNPLLDIKHVAAIRGVMVRGRWLPLAELQRLREEVARKYGKGK